MEMDKRVALTNLQPEDIIHPLEKSAIIDILNKIPGGKAALNGISELYGKYVAVDYMGNGVVANNDNMPRLYAQLCDTCNIIGLTEIPELATEWAYMISSYTVGGKKKRIVISSGAVDLLTENEIPFMLGEEIGHIVSGHLPYHMLLELIYTSALENTTLGAVAGLIRMPMLDWYRKSHYTADRVALLCCQDINVALQCMMKIAGLPKKYFDKVEPDVFLSQSREFEDINNDGWAAKMMRNFLLRSASMPWMVDRAKQLVDWYNSGEYQAILDKNR